MAGRYDVIVIGGGPAGLIAAATAKKNYPDKSVLVVKKEPVGLIPCGIPYIFGTLGSVEKDVMPTKGVEGLGVELLTAEVREILPSEKKIRTSDGELGYEKLVLATGSAPFVPNIPGKDLEGVYTVRKDMEYLSRLLEAVKSAEKIAIIGGGFIGVEVGDEIRKLGKHVTIIEMEDHLLPAAFDPEFGDMVQNRLEELGAKVLTSTKVEEILGNGRVNGLRLSNGDRMETDLVIFATGYKPNVSLAKAAGLRLGWNGGIWTDEYMRTSDENIFAVGDCVEHRCFFTRRPSGLMLASTATFEARVAGANLFKLKVLRTNKGNLGIFSTAIEGLALGAAGCNENVCLKEAFDVVVGTAKAPDRHPGSIADATPLTVKLIFTKEGGILLGGQVAGGKSVGEIINIIGLAIQRGMTAVEMDTLQIGTHPLLTSAPTVYPLILAAEDALRKIR